MLDMFNIQGHRGWGGKRGLQANIFANHVAAYLFPYNLICSFGVGEGGGVEVNNQNICYHVAAYLIPFNLVCNMTMF